MTRLLPTLAALMLLTGAAWADSDTLVSLSDQSTTYGYLPTGQILVTPDDTVMDQQVTAADPVTIQNNSSAPAQIILGGGVGPGSTEVAPGATWSSGSFTGRVRVFAEHGKTFAHTP
jgi:hypothetical protein